MTDLSDPTPPSPLDEFALGLREVRIEAGSPSFSDIARRVGQIREARGSSAGSARPGVITVYDLFRTGRRRLNLDLVIDVLRALNRPELVPLWRERYRAVLRDLPTTVIRPRISCLEQPSRPELIGRDEELRRLLLGLAAEGTPGPRLAVITGLPGSGKSALARAAALDLAADRGVLVVVEASLRAEPNDEQPVVISAKALVSELLIEARRSGATHQQAPVFVIDDAPDAAYLKAVCEFLDRDSTLIATSRRDLGRIRSDTRIALEPLSDSATITLLRQRLSGTVAEDAELTSLARLSRNSPIAVELIAGRIRSEPSWSVRDHLERLKRNSGDLVPGLELIYGGLPQTARHLLHLLVLHPARLNDVEIAALLGGVSWVPDGQQAIAELSAEHLVSTAADGRFDLHDLVREFAIGHTWSQESHSVLRCRVAGLADYLLQQASEALVVIASDPLSDQGLAALSTSAWLEEHLEVLVTTAQLAADFDLAKAASAFSELLAGPLAFLERWNDAYLVHRAAERSGLPETTGMSKLLLGRSLFWLGRLGEAREVLTGLAISDPPLRHRALALLLRVDTAANSTREALAVGQDALAEAQQLGDRATEMEIWSALGILNHMVGKMTTARAASARYLELATSQNRQMEIAVAWNDLALHDLVDGKPAEAREQAERALAMLPEDSPAGTTSWVRFVLGQAKVAVGDLSGVADLEKAYSDLSMGRPGPLETEALIGLAWARVVTGDLDRAAEEFDRAYRLALQLGSPRLSAKVLNGVGMIRLAAGSYDQAEVAFSESLALARRSEAPLEIARALIGVGDLAEARGHSAQAASAWQEAVQVENVPLYARQLAQQRLEPTESGPPDRGPRI